MTWFLQRVRHHQLFFAKLQRQRARKGQPAVGRQGRRQLQPRPRPGESPKAPDWTQMVLFDCDRDLAVFDRDLHAELDNRWLVRAQRETQTWGPARGWSDRIIREVNRALVIILSGSRGEPISFCAMFNALTRRGYGTLRPAEILQRVGLLNDDRPAQFEQWLDRKLVGVASGIRRDVEHWLRTLRDGGPRTQARKLVTVWNYLNVIQPTLAEWSATYDHLREVTREDIATAADCGRKRHDRLIALRSLFRHCKKNGTIFRDPTARIRVGRYEDRAIIPLQPNEISNAIGNAQTPLGRLVIALAGVHAARTQTILLMQLDDVDLGNRRLIIGGNVHPLDDLTLQALTDWLDYRRNHWPNTANPHLMINRTTAMDTRPGSKVWITNCVRGQAATIERLRVDRQLEEALTHGPDALHLAAVFGLDDRTALRYADAARQILETEAERHAIASSLELTGPPTLNDHNGPLGSR